MNFQNCDTAHQYGVDDIVDVETHATITRHHPSRQLYATRVVFSHHNNKTQRQNLEMPLIDNKFV